MLTAWASSRACPFWQRDPAVGRLLPHRTDAGCLILAECFGGKSVTLFKDVVTLFTADPKTHPHARFMRAFQLDNGRRPELIAGPCAANRGAPWCTPTLTQTPC